MSEICETIDTSGEQKGLVKTQTDEAIGYLSSIPIQNKMATFSIKVVREAGTDGAGGPFLPRAEETIAIEAASQREAYQKSQIASKLKFMGQHRRTFINGVEYRDERY